MSAVAPEAPPTPEVRFVAPLPGLEQLTRFALVRLDDSGALYSLQSLETEGVRLVVVAPGAFFPDYHPVVDEADVEGLGLADADDALLLVVVTPGADLASSTANLLAPVVLHAGSGLAAQVVLAGSEHPLRAPLVAA
ncbi:flagellar assembly protein FliW [Pseudokineococcus lusitanus]|uniref:Flagellar assembly factor FliW n=1 Tax=Pseudokineococcus lusitanus TaxID=763993 RepID=A0A3N1HR04_9ACTN|nr:flagellar assembly protein FliW [Pseudokineococcus lusitanus]ROP44856.1 flagellar assembly factor FliW [Pseudokineococcus lusitanus]